MCEPLSVGLQIHLKQSQSQEQSNLQKFAFDPSFQPVSISLILEFKANVLLTNAVTTQNI